MSGRVDAVRNKKQSFDVFRVMQSPKSAVKIFGHWNYPKADGDNYKYNVKKSTAHIGKKQAKRIFVTHIIRRCM